MKLKIGITCYPSVGGSGVVATELGIALAKRGHQVHFITYDKPFRLGKGKQKNIYFHQVKVNEYPLFRYPDYTLPLAVKMAEVAEKYQLDLFHVHYAVPHATAALLARAMSHACRMCAPKVITTLHGTDISLLAQDKNLQPAIKFSIERSDGVTAVSHALAKETAKSLRTKKPIEVIHNFFDSKKPSIPAKKIRANLKIKNDEFLLLHMSNLRGVKRIEDLLYIMARLPKNSRSKLLLLSAGDFKPFKILANKLRVNNKVIIKSGATDIANYINAADAGIYTSETESFGMGILETMAYGKPVLATKAGGVPEVIADKKTGLLHRVGDIKGFAKSIITLENNIELTKTLGANSALRAKNLFTTEKAVERYEKYYMNILNDNHKHRH